MSLKRIVGQPVTPEQYLLPILVPAVENEPVETDTHFLVHTEPITGGTRSKSGTQRLRLVTEDDIAAAETIFGDDYDLLRGTLELKQGHLIDDETLKARAYRKLWRWLPISGGRDDLQSVGDLPEVLASYKEWAKKHFPQVATKQLNAVRLVTFFSQRMNRFSPGLFCPDVKTGIFVRALIDIRICPYCSTLFIPKAENVFYCQPRHRDNYRVIRKRFRDEEKRKARAARKHRRRAAMIHKGRQK